MSTKIFDAYRIKKSTDILSLLVKSKEIAATIIANSADLLHLIHANTTLAALNAVKNNPEDRRAKRVLELNENNDIDLWWIKMQLEKLEKDIEYNPLDIYTSCSIFYDRKYWYIKFYPNSKIQIQIVDKIVEEFALEDYHYQNQTDPPEHIPYKTYQARDKKWDQLLGKDGTYNNGLQFTIFDANEFGNLVSRFYYQGKKTKEELYSHLAYKFDKYKTNG